MTRRRIHRARGTRRVVTAMSVAATAGIVTVLSAQGPGPASAPLPDPVTSSDIATAVAPVPPTTPPTVPPTTPPTVPPATSVPATPSTAVPTIRLTAEPVLQAAPVPQAAAPDPAVRTSGSH